MEKESNISLGGAVILLALHAQKHLCAEKIHFESILLHSQLFHKNITLQKKGKTKKITTYFLFTLSKLYLFQPANERSPHRLLIFYATKPMETTVYMNLCCLKCLKRYIMVMFFFFWRIILHNKCLINFLLFAGQFRMRIYPKSIISQGKMHWKGKVPLQRNGKVAITIKIIQIFDWFESIYLD